jgi:hypothetical protein
MGRGLRIGFPAPGSSSSFDFTVASTQDPLSMGGLFTNNTQATGSNTVFGDQSSMRIIAAASGGINIATGDSTGQSSPPAATDYMDSFAFVPGFSGNQRVTATIYVDTGYAPPAGVDSHEIGLLVGCMTSSAGGGIHRWLQFNWSQDAANRFMASFGTGANGDYPGAYNDYAILSPTDSGALSRRLQDGDVMRLDYNRTTGTIISYLNSTQIMTLTDLSGFNALNLGDGAGITMFRRTANGQTASNRLGFKNLLVESF